MRKNTNGRLLQGKGLQIQINNKSQPSASADNTNLCLNNIQLLDETKQNIVIYQWRADQLFADAEGRGK